MRHVIAIAGNNYEKKIVESKFKVYLKLFPFLFISVLHWANCDWGLEWHL